MEWMVKVENAARSPKRVFSKVDDLLGDLYNNENIKDLGYRIQTDTGLVDLVVADGVSRHVIFL